MRPPAPHTQADWLQWAQHEAIVYGDPRWRMPSRPSSYKRADESDEEMDILGRFRRDGDSDDDMGLPTNLQAAST